MRSAFRRFCLLCAAFRLNALLWNGGQHGYRILVPNLYRYHCLWRLDCRCHDRYWLGALTTTNRPCGVDQPLSSNSRFENPVAESAPALFSISTACTMNLSANLRSYLRVSIPDSVSQLTTCVGLTSQIDGTRGHGRLRAGLLVKLGYNAKAKKRLTGFVCNFHPPLRTSFYWIITITEY